MVLFNFSFRKSKRKDLSSFSIDEKKALETTGEYEVVLQSRGSTPLQVCKILHNNITMGDLLKAKTLADSAPCVIKSAISQQGAEALQRELEKVGAIVLVKKPS